MFSPTVIESLVGSVAKSSDIFLLRVTLNARFHDKTHVEICFTIVNINKHVLIITSTISIHSAALTILCGECTLL